MMGLCDAPAEHVLLSGATSPPATSLGRLNGIIRGRAHDEADSRGREMLTRKRGRVPSEQDRDDVRLRAHRRP
jgi:hypothetical protein